MKVVILAGGYGTRLTEETIVKPKPMVEIGGYPIIWHIMNIYWSYGFSEFIIALGYKGNVIKEYFLNYSNLQSDLTISLKTGEFTASKTCQRDWFIHLANTGLDTMTGGRLIRLKNNLLDNTFMLTYGDGVSNVNIEKLLDFHKSHGKIATVTAVRPTARFGAITIKDNQVVTFKEKTQTGEGWINGGFFVFEPGIFDYINDDRTILEGEPLENLSQDGQLMAYKHYGFWQCMDTLRDKHTLDMLWENGNATWKVWR